MNGFFSFTESDNIIFKEFSLNHIIPILVIIIGVYLIYRYRDSLSGSKYEKQIRYSIAIFAILLEVSFQAWQMNHQEWNFAESLPLHLCRLTNYLAIFSMLTKNEKVFKIAYFWSLAGVVSILFPDIKHGHDRFRYYHFMIYHILFFYMYMYMLFVLKIKLTFKSFKKSYLILLSIVMIIIIPINNLFNMNYMYLLEPKDTPFSIFYGNGYIIYLIGSLGLTTIVMILWYLPIHFYNKKLLKKEN